MWPFKPRKASTTEKPPETNWERLERESKEESRRFHDSLVKASEDARKARERQRHKIEILRSDGAAQGWWLARGEVMFDNGFCRFTEANNGIEMALSGSILVTRLDDARPEIQGN